MVNNPCFRHYDFLAKNRCRMATAINFSRQNDAGSLVSTTDLLLRKSCPRSRPRLWLRANERNIVGQQLPTLLDVKPRANGRNIVGQQLPTLFDVTCCVRLYILLHVVGCCCAKFETGQTFQPTTPNISFVP